MGWEEEEAEAEGVVVRVLPPRKEGVVEEVTEAEGVEEGVERRDRVPPTLLPTPPAVKVVHEVALVLGVMDEEA